MKKNLFIVFAMVIGFAFAGCSTSPVKDSASASNGAPTTVQEAEDVAADKAAAVEAEA